MGCEFRGYDRIASPEIARPEAAEALVSRVHAIDPWGFPEIRPLLGFSPGILPSGFDPVPL